MTVTGPRMTLVPPLVKEGALVLFDQRRKGPERHQPNAASRLVCTVPERLNPFCPKVFDQSTPRFLLPVFVMLITRTWTEIWRLGTSMDLRYRAIFGITVSLSLTTIVLICGSSDANRDRVLRNGQACAGYPPAWDGDTSARIGTPAVAAW